LAPHSVDQPRYWLTVRAVILVGWAAAMAVSVVVEPRQVRHPALTLVAGAATATVIAAL